MPNLLCQECQSDLILNSDGYLICTRCGLVQDVTLSPFSGIPIPIIRSNIKFDEVLKIYCDPQERRVLLKVRGKRNAKNRTS
jgi:hypothetical protein